MIKKFNYNGPLRNRMRLYMEGEGDGGGGDGDGADWRAALPEDMRGSDALKDVADVPSLAKQFVDQQAYLGNAIRIPGDDASAEDRKAFNDKLSQRVPELVMSPTDEASTLALMKNLGMPDAADGYKVEMPEGLNMPEDRMAQIKDMAHQAGLTATQFEQFAGKVMAMDAALLGEMGAKLEAGISELKGEWGAAYDQNVAAALNVAEQSGAPADLVEAIKNNGANQATLKWLHGLSTTAKEGQHFNKSDGADNILAPAEANAQVDEIMRNKEHPYWRSSDPGHKAAVDKVLELMKLANPGAGTDMNALRAGPMGSP